MSWISEELFDSQQRQEIFLISKSNQTGSETHPVSHTMGSRGVFPTGIKSPGVKLTTNLHLMTRLKMRGDMTSIPYLPPWHAQKKIYFMISNFRRVLKVVCFLLGNSPALNFICRHFGTLCLFHIHRHVPTCLWRRNRQCVLKCRHIKFRWQGITQKKAYRFISVYIYILTLL